MLVVGLTGGIATGKSSVSAQLKSFGLPVVDADVIARQVVEPGTPTLAQIVKHFGEDILHPDGTLNRQKLGSIVFNDESQRKVLNSITHPAIARKMFLSVLTYWLKGYNICIVDNPLLIEGGMHKWMGKVVVVYCSPELQLQRLRARDSSSVEAASSRIKAQLPTAEKLKHADIVVDNSGSPQDLQIQVDSLVRRLNKEIGWWRLNWLCPPIGIISAAWTLLWRHIRRLRQTPRKR
ncbi:CoaE-domain-containing protein [Irpex rosettiformis]|uniref:CoaE-domain-containing protein n=1 Tax=Irpex rosettiformis TaxID=378272 RepID=A0ACB8TWA9_9APHY|nr:CoaE-domain-containing protein [Irpex rosettiformis]